jgi:hypothetical protein
MDETQTLAVQALRELLDDPNRNDWDELIAANRALIKAIATGEPMTRRNTRQSCTVDRNGALSRRPAVRTLRSPNPRQQRRNRKPG